MLETVKHNNKHYALGVPYSTEERRIGTWIDGKPLYRRIYESEYLTSGETILGAISDIKVIMIQGWFINVLTNYIQPIGDFRENSSTYTSRVFFDGSNVKSQQNSSYQTGDFIARVVIEYTKTTD